MDLAWDRSFYRLQLHLKIGTVPCCQHVARAPDAEAIHLKDLECALLACAGLDHSCFMTIAKMLRTTQWACFAFTGNSGFTAGQSMQAVVKPPFCLVPLADTNLLDEIASDDEQDHQNLAGPAKLHAQRHSPSRPRTAPTEGRPPAPGGSPAKSSRSSFTRSMHAARQPSKAALVSEKPAPKQREASGPAIGTKRQSSSGSKDQSKNGEQAPQG